MSISHLAILAPFALLLLVGAVASVVILWRALRKKSG